MENNEWENFEDEIIIEEDNIFDKISQDENQIQKEQDQFDLFDQLAGNPTKDIKKIYESDLNFFENLASAQPIQTSQQELQKSQISENTNQQSNLLSQKKNLMGSLFSYLTSSEGSTPQSNPQIQYENPSQNKIERQSLRNESQIQNVQDSISNLGASYFAAAKKTLLGDNNLQKPQESLQFDKKIDFQKQNIKDQFSQQNLNEIPENHKIDQNTVLQSIIEQNKNLKSLLIKQRIEIKRCQINDQNSNLAFETSLDEVLRQCNLETQNLQNFDPQKEFKEIQQLYNANKLSASQQDISYLYSSCFYSKDLLLIQNLKVKIFQTIAQRALRNQEILFKSTQRRGLSFNEINPVHIYIENNQMRQTNQGLRGQLEQLQQTLQNQVEISNQNEKAYKEKIFSLGISLENQKKKISNLKQNWSHLKNETKTFNSQLKDPKIFQGIKSVIYDSASRYDKEIETFRKSLLQKNKEIGDLFMKNKKQEEHFEQKLKDLEKSIRQEQEKDLGTLVFQKNQEIAKQYNENLQFKQKIENLQQERYEQIEILETVQQESAMLKDQLRGFQLEKKELIEQIQKHEKINKEIQSLVDEYQAEVEQFQTQISEKDGELQEIQEFIQMKNDELRQMEDEIDQYQIDIDKKQVIIDQLTNQLKEINCLNSNDKLQYGKEINELQSKVSILEEQIKDSTCQQVYIETPIVQIVPRLNLQNISKTGNNVLFQITQNENKEQQNIENIFAPQISQIFEEKEIKVQEDIELNNDVINEWGASMSSDLDLQQSINLQLNEIDSNQNDVKDATEEEFVRMKSHLDSSKLDIIVSQIEKPNHESQKLDHFFQELKMKEQIQKMQINEELDREIFDNNQNEQFENNLTQINVDNNNQQDNEKIVIQEQQWGELDIQLESDRTIEKSMEEPIQTQLPSKRKQKHKKQKSVHLQKSNQFQNYNNQQYQDKLNDQENKSVKKENQMYFFQDINEQDQNILVINQKKLNEINEEDFNAQGDQSARKENSKELKNSLSSKKQPQINIDQAESIENNILSNNHINQKEKDNDFNSSVFPDSIYNQDGKDEEQDIMIMTINSGDANLQMLDSVQSGKYSFIQDGLQNNIFSTNSPQKQPKEFILEYQEHNQFVNLDKDLLDFQDVEVEEMNAQKQFHQKASQSLHQRNAEMIDQVIMGTQVSENLEDQEFLQQRLNEQLEEYDQNNLQQQNLIQDLVIDNIKPPAQPDEQIQTGELPEQILSDLEEDLEIQQNENLLVNSVEKDQITSIFEEQNKNLLIEIIPEMEIEDDDENIQQDQILQNQFEEEKVQESKVETNIEIELQDDLWGGDANMDLVLNQQNEVLPIDFIINEKIDEQASLPEDNHLQKSQQYQNIRKSNKQKQKDKLNLKDKFLLLNQTNDFPLKEQQKPHSIKQINNQMKTQNSEIQDINRMIAEDINQKEKEDLGNIYNQISIIQQNRALESERVHTSKPLQHFQQARTDLEDEQILQNSSQKLPHGHSNSQQFVQQNQSKPLNTIRQNKKQIPNPVIKNMMENVPNFYLPSESLEEVEYSYKESEYYSPIKKKFEDQTSYITSSEYNGLSSQKKMRRIQIINQAEEECLQEIDLTECEEKENIEKVIEDVKGEEMDEDDKDKNTQSPQNDVDFVFSELDAENEFSLGVSENQNSQNKAEVFDQILKGQQQASNLDYIDLNNFQLNDFENEIQSIQSIASESVIYSVQEPKKEENINQLFDSVNFEKEKIKQVQIQMDSVQENFRKQRKNLTNQNNQ